MKSVRPERLNHTHVCPQCGGFLAVFGNEKNDEWQCTRCNLYYSRELLDRDAPELYVLRKDMEMMELDEYIKERKGSNGEKSGGE